eukprot:5717766-Lingulodinium_polyedra.AAC.1
MGHNEKCHRKPRKAKQRPVTPVHHWDHPKHAVNIYTDGVCPAQIAGRSQKKKVAGRVRPSSCPA